MREYYLYLFPNLPSGEKADKFKKKYMSYGQQGFKYNTSFWGSGSAYIVGIYFYQENGKYYEFFSDYELGVKGDKEILSSYYYIPIKSELYGKIIIETNDPDNDIQRAAQLTASQFAADVKPHLKYKNQISAMMRQYFSILHQKWIEDNRRKVAAELREESRNNHNADWLEEYLDHKSH